VAERFALFEDGRLHGQYTTVCLSPGQSPHLHIDVHLLGSPNRPHLDLPIVAILSRDEELDIVAETLGKGEGLLYVAPQGKGLIVACHQLPKGLPKGEVGLEEVDISIEVDPPWGTIGAAGVLSYIKQLQRDALGGDMSYLLLREAVSC
jgi:hypothetical protein